MKTDMGLLLLRFVAGGLMLTHGVGKVSDLFSGPIEFPDPLGIGPVASLALAAFAEFLCAILVIVGFKVRWTAVPIVITMLVAAFIFHASDGMEQRELPLLYAAAFATISMAGAGRWSLDDWLEKRKTGARR